MQLSKKDKDKVSKWLGEKCGQMRCFCCGHGQWQLSDASTLSVGYDLHTTRFYYHQGMPAIAVICSNCGHAVFFSPGAMGFRPDEPPVHEKEKRGRSQKKK